MAYCGLDFGTSNSTLGTVQDGIPSLLPLEKGKPTIPSALFFHFDSDEIFYGREAIEEYIEGEFGRLMRSLKSVLGTPRKRHHANQNSTYCICGYRYSIHI